MSLRDALILSKPRETGGARNDAGLAYQHHWALRHLIRLHRSGSEYAIAFDYHDDVLVVDSETDPQAVWFYQIKTSEASHWTLSELLANKKRKPRPVMSILGTLFRHRLTFAEYPVVLTLVSNIPFQFRLRGAQNTTFMRNVRADELADNLRMKIAEQMQVEHSIAEPGDISGLIFESSDILLTDPSLVVRADLMDLIVEVHPTRSVEVIQPLYHALLAEVQQKNRVFEICDSFEGLVSKKAISRTAFQALLERALASNTLTERWKQNRDRLNVEKINFSALKRLDEQFHVYYARQSNAADLYLHGLREQLKSLTEVALQGEEVSMLSDLLPLIVATFRATSPSCSESDWYLYAILLSECL